MAASKSTGAFASVLAETVVVTGRITGDGDLEIRGRVDGEVDIQGDLTLAEGAMARASLSGARVTIGGAVVGDVTATDAIVLEATARVVGNLTAPRIAVALGAQLRGDLDMGTIAGEGGVRTTPRAARAPAPAAKPVALPARKSPVAVPAVPAAPAVRRAPPEPVVPAIKKGAKAAKKRA